MVKDLSVLEAKRFGTYYCSPQDTLGFAADEMTDRNISALVVQDQDGYLRASSRGQTWCGPAIITTIGVRCRLATT